MPEIPEATVRQAEAISTRLSAQVQAARSNPNLSEEGRLREIATAYLNAKKSMGVLEDRFTGQARTTLDQDIRDVFGSVGLSGADAISARDAGDRASQITEPTEAMRMLEWALTNGDQMLARAIGKQALDQCTTGLGRLSNGGWAEVLDRFATAGPSSRVERVNRILDVLNGTPQDMVPMFIFAVHKPTELERFGDHRIAALAAG